MGATYCKHLLPNDFPGFDELWPALTSYDLAPMMAVAEMQGFLIGFEGPQRANMAPQELRIWYM